jgi:hypothetical protein
LIYINWMRSTYYKVEETVERGSSDQFHRTTTERTEHNTYYLTPRGLYEERGEELILKDDKFTVIDSTEAGGPARVRVTILDSEERRTLVRRLKSQKI